MFYSNEVLTSRKYGVATVWLVATMGIKSGVKKVGRKAILDVDVSKACSTVLAPEAPMALRLQSNLLFGIARVYAQQCGYVLSDVEAARNTMRAMLKGQYQNNMLQPEGQTRAKPDLLQDDPAFMPGLDFMNLDGLNFGDLNLDSGVLHEESQSTLSPHNSQMTNTSQHSIGGLMLPPSASSFTGGPVGGSDLFGLRGNSVSGANVQPALLLEDDLFVVGEDGTMNFDDLPVRHSSDKANAAIPSSHGKDTGAENVDINMPDQGIDDGFMPLPDDDQLDIEMPQAAELQHETSSETATAPLRRRRVQKVNIVPIDHTTQLSNRELSERNKTYPEDMRAAGHHKQNNKLAAIAKKNAEYWVLGDFNSFGKGIHGPLDLFTGARLFEAFTGIKLGPSGGQKRPREEQAEASPHIGRRVRSRGENSVDEIARGLANNINEDDNFLLINNNDDDDTIEQGREAPTPLDERQASSIFPWNQSATAASRRLTDAAAAHLTSATIAGGVGGAGAGTGGTQLSKALRRATSRLTSASPLTGRGILGGNNATELDDLDLDSDYAIGGDGMTNLEEFELFGPAAQVDTQTAVQSQWVRATLLGESANFLDFVRTAIEGIEEHRVAADVDEEEDGGVGGIEFETLLPLHQSRIVAAQGFLHVLAVGARGLVGGEREEGFGGLRLRIMS